MLILHGENLVESRQQLQAAKRGKQVLSFGPDVTVDQIIPVVEADSLFGGSYVLVIENILSSHPTGTRKAVLNYLANHQNKDIILWEGKDVSSKIKGFDPKLVRRFDLPKYIFSFLDHPTTTGLHRVLQTLPAEQILASLATRAHKRAYVTWIKDLLEIDYAQKTSSAPYDLATALELWVARL